MHLNYFAYSTQIFLWKLGFICQTIDQKSDRITEYLCIAMYYHNDITKVFVSLFISGYFSVYTKYTHFNIPYCTEMSSYKNITY